MTITQQDVQHVAKLARLELTPEEVQRYTQELSKIIDLVNQLNQLDLSSVDLNLKPEHETLFREDIPKQLYSREVLLKNAPHEEEDFFRVPQILESAEL